MCEPCLERFNQMRLDIKCLLDASVWQCSRHVQVRKDPAEEPELTGGIILYVPFGLGSSKKSWKDFLQKRNLEYPEMWKMMDA